jgi:uncharacterized membrane protein YqjE
MNTEAGGQDSSGGFARVIDMLRQTAQRAAEVAAGAVRAQANGVVDAYRAELRRAAAVFALACAVLLFAWSGILVAVLALEFAFWDTHRTAASLWGAAGLIVLAGSAALILWRLTRRGHPVR